MFDDLLKYRRFNCQSKKIGNFEEKIAHKVVLELTNFFSTNS